MSSPNVQRASLRSISDPRTARVALVASLAVLTLVLVGQPSNVATVPFLYAISITLISLAGMMWALYAREMPFQLAATFFVFCYLFFGISPFMSFRLGHFAGGSTYSSSELVYAYQVILIGMFCYTFAWWVQTSAHRSPSVRLPRQTPKNWQVRLIVITSIVLLTSLLIWISWGALRLSTVNRYSAEDIIYGPKRSNGLAINSIKLSLMRIPPAVLLITFIATRAFRVNRTLALLFAGLITTNLLVSSPFSTPRQWLGTLIVASLLAAFPSPRGIRICMLATVVGTFILFPALDGLRSSSQLAFGDYSPTRSLGQTYDFDSFSTTIDATTAVEATGLQKGRQLMGVVTFAVPRAIWPSKPEPSGDYLFAESPTNHSPTPNTSVTLWAEGYIDFGILGTAGYLALLGFVSARLEQSSTLGASSTRQRVLVPLLAGYQFIVLRGALLPLVSGAVTIAFVYILVAWCIGDGQRIFGPSRGISAGTFTRHRKAWDSADGSTADAQEPIARLRREDSQTELAPM
jgi:hypothetical protein